MKLMIGALDEITPLEFDNLSEPVATALWLKARWLLATMIPINQLPLSQRAQNVCTRNNLQTIRDLLNMAERPHLNAKGLGVTTCREISEVVWESLGVKIIWQKHQ